MNLKFYCGLLFAGTLFTCLSVSGQDLTLVDSLSQLISVSHNNQEKMKLYNEIARQYVSNSLKFDTVEMYIDSMLQVAGDGNQWATAMSTYLQASMNRQRSNYDLALSQYDEYIEFQRQRGDSLQVARTLYEKGIIHKEKGDYDKNIAIQFSIIDIYRKENKMENVANAFQSIGNVYRVMGKYDDALKMYEQATGIYDSLDLKKRYAMGIYAIGNVYISQKDYDTGIMYQEQALAIIEPLELNFEKGYILESIGVAYEEMDHDEKALEIQLQTLAIRRSLPHRHSLANTLINVGYLHYKIKNYGEARRYFLEAQEILEQIRAKKLLMEVYDHMADVNFATANYRLAFDYLQKHTQLKDSVLNEEQTRQISELQAKYETAEKDRKIALLVKDNEVQQARAEQQTTLSRALIMGIVFLILIAALIFYIMRERIKNQKLLLFKNEEIKVSRLKEEMVSLEIKALRAQMNPHFLFNSLNSVNTMILGNNNDSASKYLSKFSKLVRSMLENSESSRVALKDELDMLETYIQLESMRFGNKIDYEITVDENVDQESSLIPSMVLQPFVENAIWHGLLHKDSDGMLRINIYEKDDYLHCTIVDNGIGREKSLTMKKEGGKKKSLGIKITADRLKLLTQQKVNDLINIIDLKDEKNNAIGTEVNILIPIS